MLIESSNKEVKRVLVQANFPLGPSRGWIKFFNCLLQTNKIDFPDVNGMLPANYSISFNHTSGQFNKICNLNIPLENRILVMLECEAVLPEMHRKKILDQYGIIFSPSPLWAPRHEKFIFNYPLFPKVDVNSLKTNSQDYDCGMIQRNLYSCIRGEMYTMRRSVIKELLLTDLDFQLRGEGWQRTTFANFLHFYRLLQFQIRKRNFENLKFFPKHFQRVNSLEAMPVKNKLDFLSRAKTTLVIENSIDYVSEKIFDCFRAGTVPIYIGPPLSIFGIPEGLVIVSPPQADVVTNILKNINRYDLDGFRNRARIFMLKEGNRWCEEDSLGNLANNISELLLRESV